MKILSLSIGCLILLLCVSRCSEGNPEEAVDGMTAEAFEALMGTLATGWNEGNAKMAADCFTEDAVYTEPPDKQVYRGRDALYTFFGGDEGREGQMQMTWHHLVFDEERQVGMGEFTFTFGTPAHGAVVVKIRDGKISNWREYWYESELEWDEFIKENRF